MSSDDPVGDRLRAAREGLAEQRLRQEAAADLARRLNALRETVEGELGALLREWDDHCHRLAAGSPARLDPDDFRGRLTRVVSTAGHLIPSTGFADRWAAVDHGRNFASYLPGVEAGAGGRLNPKQQRAAYDHAADIVTRAVAGEPFGELVRLAITEDALRGTLTYLGILLRGAGEFQRLELHEPGESPTTARPLATRDTAAIDPAAADLPSPAEPQRPVADVAPPSNTPDPAVKHKRSTVRGEGREKLVAALTKHHKYADGSCLNTEYIGNNELAELADVSTSTASTFFTKKFGGHMQYQRLCQDAQSLVASLKLLNGEYSPIDLYGRRPPGEGGRCDD